MSTALNGTEPVLDLDAMLEDLHNNFEGDPIAPVEEPPAGEVDEGTGEQTPPEPTGVVDQGTTTPDPLDEMLPPGVVQFGDEVLPVEEVKALLELNRRVKSDADMASRVRSAVLGQTTAPSPTQQQTDPDALPEFIDPDDQQAVFLFRQNQRMERELAEVRRQEATRLQAQQRAAEDQRTTMVRDAFRVAMKEFRDQHPALDLNDLNAIANRAANMKLLENPEAVGGTLQGGILTALESAMWSAPEFRQKVLPGATVRTQEQQSQERKQKSSALSSSTGSVVRTQSQEQTPTTRSEVMAGALDFLRSVDATE